jgi:hypothetical protein
MGIFDKIPGRRPEEEEEEFDEGGELGEDIPAYDAAAKPSALDKFKARYESPQQDIAAGRIPRRARFG